MARQPYLRVVSPKIATQIQVGTTSVGTRPELETLVGNCLMMWPNVEAEMALFLGHLVGAHKSAPILAVFQSLRRSSSQRDAISDAAKVSLDEPANEMLSAVLNVHKAIEAERNALAHGHFGAADSIPDGILWMNAADYVAIRIYQHHADQPWDAEAKRRLLENVWVYRKQDLETIFDDIKELIAIWLNFTRFITLHPVLRPRAEVYQLLCDRPRIGQELEKLRQKNGRATPFQSSQPNQHDRPKEDPPSR